MSRPKGSKKGRTLPMSSLNGEGASKPTIPPDIEWDENDPPVIFRCTNHTEHAPDCDGDCEALECTEWQVKLLNEGKAWRRLDMDFRGIPTVIADVMPVNGIHVEIFDQQCTLMALQQVLMDNGLLDKTELDEKFREAKYTIMHDVRVQNEEQIKAMRDAALEQEKRAALGLPPKRLLGPHGEQLG